MDSISGVLLAAQLLSGPAPVAQAGNFQPYGQITPICAARHNLDASGRVAGVITVTGQVTSDFVHYLGGFHLQEPACDDDPATSDAVFVADRRRAAEVYVGLWVVAAGTIVRQADGRVVLELESLLPIDPPTPATVAPLPLELPADPDAAAELMASLDSMLVVLGDGHVVGATNRRGEAFIAPRGAPERFFQRDTDARRIGYFTPGWWLPLRHGDRIGDAEGPLHFAAGRHMIAGIDGLEPFVDRQLGHPQPLAMGRRSELRVGTYNLTEFFDPVDDPDRDDGPWTPSPVIYRVGVEMRARSIANYLSSPEVLVVQEVETAAVLRDLAARPVLASAPYAALLEEGFDRRGLNVGMLYNRRRLELLEVYQAVACAAGDPGPPDGCQSPDGNPLYSNPPLVAVFRDLRSGSRISVVGVHVPAATPGADSLDRLDAQLGHLADLVSQLRANDPNGSVAVAGTLAARAEAVETLLTSRAGLDDLHAAAPRAERYTTVIDGQSALADYVLVATQGQARLEVARINVDYAAPPASDPTRSHRASDHDPVLVRLTLGPPEPVYLPALTRP